MKEILKSKKVIIYIVIILILLIGTSSAYFVSRVITNIKESKIEAQTAEFTSKVEAVGIVGMDNVSMYPGHKELIKVKVIGKGITPETEYYNLIFKGINTFNSNMKYKVYKSNSDLDLNIKCEAKTKVVNGKQLLYEECTDNIELEEVSSGVLTKNATEHYDVLKKTEEIEITEKGTEIYYYVEIEYENNINEAEDQNNDMTSKLEGIVTIEEGDGISPTKPKVRLASDKKVEFYDSTDDKGGVKYYYSYDNNNYVEGNNLVIGESKDIYVYALDEAGNKSEIEHKRLNIANSQTIASTLSYKCTDGSHKDKTNSCVRAETKTYTENYSMTCNAYQAAYGSWSSETTAEDQESCTATTVACNSSSDNNKSNVTCEPTTSTLRTCPSGMSIKLSSNKCVGTFNAGTNCTAGPCMSKCTSLGYKYYDGSCSNCQCSTDISYETITTYTSKSKTCTWHNAVNGTLAAKVVSSSSGACDNGSHCTVTTTNCSNTGASCTTNKTCSGSCSNTCNVNYTGTTEYYCSLNNKYYDNQSDANNACSNYCATGDYYNNKCYELV